MTMNLTAKMMLASHGHGSGASRNGGFPEGDGLLGGTSRVEDWRDEGCSR